MKLNAVNNSPHFGMAWNKSAKQILSKSVAHLSENQQPEAIRIINHLEKNSPYHTLNCTEDVVVAAQKTVAGSSFYESGNSNFLKKLQKLSKFITRENKLIPVINETAKKLAKPLNFMLENGIFDNGLRINKQDLPYLAAELVTPFLIKNKQPNMDKIVGKLTAINEKAKKNDIGITLGFLNKGYFIGHRGTNIVREKHATNTLETFDKINKILDKIIKKTQKEKAKETKKYRDEIEQITQTSAKREFIKKLKAKISSNKIIQMLGKIKTMILAPIQKLQDAKLQKIQTTANKVVGQLEI